ncbi:MAG: sterol desaturase family protein [Myxococcales bacterium]|nr:sterol desaturase family protein [Myxococcales bacterium]MDP3499080.1 sterol desaturase family protein [Myxococcales bacterium]
MELIRNPLALLVLAALFVPLERLWPLRKTPLLRPGWKTDVAHFFCSHPLQQLSLVLAIGVIVSVVDPFATSVVQRQPMVFQWLEALLLLELIGYGMHRAFHEVPALWRIHAVHHSSEHLDWLASLRVHPLDQTLTRSVQFLVFTLLGFPVTLFAGASVLLGLWAIFLHANVRFRFGGLERVIATPAFHHWHHAREARGNYAGLFPWVDSLFGTNVTSSAWPTASGTDDAPPERYWAHLTLRRKDIAGPLP